MTLEEINTKLTELYAERDLIREQDKLLTAEINDLIYQASKLRSKHHD